MLVLNTPEEADWLHEIKYDGYRTELVVEGRQARAFTRRGYDWSHRYKRIVQAAAQLPVKSAILDGEAVVLGSTGLPDFQALERELGNANSHRAGWSLGCLLMTLEFTSRPTRLNCN
ncbi:hypothetical protein [Mesorhizobium sp. LNHC221B00]|uniref:ATP-dependent DNA ligase n=1 Tax=Mesorhizobium sp. LNHC221B00 TaxID=1287233 RepID=UPI000A04A695|nr:hypothetical protein [Mesorhizobium sp. LNHC221B00]